MPNLFTLIGNAWRFYRKQPALNGVLFWLMFLPITAVNVLTQMLTPPPTGVTVPGSYSGMVAPSASAMLLFLPLLLVFTLAVVWGSACVLLVGKRLIQSKAGRARTSFAAVRSDAMAYVMPLFLTGILRACFTIFWCWALSIPYVIILILACRAAGISDIETLRATYSPVTLGVGFALGYIALMLSLLPGIIYSIRTVFYEIVVVAEDKAYRPALGRSKQIVRGHTWRIFFYMLGLSVVLYLPAIIATAIMEWLVLMANQRLLPLVDVGSAAVTSFASLLFLLAAMNLYGALKKARPQQIEG